MCCFHVVVALAAFLVVSWFLRERLQRCARNSWRRFTAWLNNSMLDADEAALASTREKIYSRLHERSAQVDGPLQIVEIGTGPGSNFRFLPKNSELYCVDPNEHTRKYLERNAAKFPEVRVKKFHVGVAEDMSFVESGTIDAVICSHVLCTVADVDQVLREIRRVLKKGGHFCFIEHTAAPAGSAIHRWQIRLRRIWYFLFDGCDLTRRVQTNIEGAGFAKTDIDLFNLEIADTLSAPLKPLALLFQPHLSGVVTK